MSGGVRATRRDQKLHLSSSDFFAMQFDSRQRSHKRFNDKLIKMERAERQNIKSIKFRSKERSSRYFESGCSQLRAIPLICPSRTV